MDFALRKYLAKRKWIYFESIPFYHGTEHEKFPVDLQFTGPVIGATDMDIQT
jgi:hypothetical protein